MNDVETQPAEQTQQSGFQVRLSNFEGPFDLLLQLIFAHRLDVTEVALHQVTDDFIAYTKAIGPQMELEETTAFLVVAATLLDLKAAPAAARRRSARRGGPRAARRSATCCSHGCCSTGRSSTSRRCSPSSRPRRCAAIRGRWRWRQRYEDLLPEVMLGVDAESFAQIAAAAFTPRPVPTVATEHLHQVMVSVPEQAEQAAGRAGAPRDGAVGDVLRAGRRLRGADRDRRAGSWRCSNCIGRGR